MMRLVFFDCESFYDPANGYTLKKMSTESYIRDSRFELHGAAIRWNDYTLPQWYDERQLRHVLADEDWSDVFLVSHHAAFDHLILSHHYDVHPAMSGCTMSMARLMFGPHIGVSLDSVRSQFGLTAKITPYGQMEGKHWREMPEHVRRSVADGAIDEVQSKAVIFRKMLEQGFPIEELEVVDSTIKMFSEPCLSADLEILAQVWMQENEKKKALFARLNLQESELQSADRFAELLRKRGVEPETKEGKNGRIYAFAKTDPAMSALLEHDDEEVRALAEARLGAKSTLLQTRAETVGFMQRRGGNVPVYLRYAGAHTSRWSGGDGCLAGDTAVLVFDYQKGLTKKHIVNILIDDLVWDGQEFVSHEGIKFSGYQETIEHDGVRGTTNHPVFDQHGELCALGEVSTQKKKIMVCRKPTRGEVDRARKRDVF